MNALHTLLRDLARIAPLLAVGALLMWGRDWQVVAFSAGIVLVLAAVSHATRRVLLPGVDLQLLISKAAKSSVGAGLAVLGVLYVLGVLIQAGAMFLR